MINAKMTTLKIRRIDICDLMLACLAAKSMSTDGGKKWERLHEELKRQLDEFDRQNGI